MFPVFIFNYLLNSMLYIFVFYFILVLNFVCDAKSNMVLCLKYDTD